MTLLNPSARFYGAFLLFLTVIFLNRIELVLPLFFVLLTLSIRNGWKKGGGPSWWFVGITFVFITLIHCVSWYPNIRWNINGVWKGILVALKLLSFLSIHVWLMSKLTPVEIISFFEKITYPIRYFRRKNLGMSLGIATSVLPEMQNELHIVKLSMQSRYSSSTSRNRLQLHYLKSILPVLFIRAMRRTDDIAIALYCRGWRDGRVFHNEENWSNLEIRMVVFLTLLMFVSLFLRLFWNAS